MGRNLRTTVPMAPLQLTPETPKVNRVKKKEEIKSQANKNFNTHHRARTLPPLHVGEQVWLPDNATEGTVEKETILLIFLTKYYMLFLFLFHLVM